MVPETATGRAGPERVELGATGLRVHPLIPATWSFAGRRGPLGAQLPPEEIERAFHEYGLNGFFTTPKMRAQAEGVRQLIAAGHRSEMVLISVAGLPFAGRIRAYVRRCCRSFGTDRLDILLMGWVQHRFYLRPAVWEAMQQLKARGLVGALGFSIHNRLLAARLASELEPRPDILMIRYNAAHRGAETEIFDVLGSERPGVIAYTATRWGELLEPRPAEGYEQGMRAPECYRFVLGHRSVDAVLCAARSAAELREDIEGIRAGPLTPERYAEILEFGDAVHRKPRHGGSRFMFRQG